MNPRTKFSRHRNDPPQSSYGNRLLEVRQLWWDDTQDVRTIGLDRARVVIGEDKDADFFAPSEMLPQESFPIARMVNGEAQISLTKKSTGLLRFPDGRVLSLAQLMKDRRVGPDPECSGCRVLSLPSGAVATVSFGTIGFSFRTVARAQGLVSRWTERLDTSYLNFLLIALFTLVATVATVLLRPVNPPLVEEELLKAPDRFAQFIVQRNRTQEKEALALSAKPTTEIRAASASAPRHAGTEGKAGKKGIPDTGKRAAMRAVKPEDPNRLANAGLIPLLGGSHPMGLSLANGKTGLGGDMISALGNLTGKVPGDSGGAFGMGRKGFGPGGGGVAKTIGFGRIGTHGTEVLGTGGNHRALRMRHRDEANININTGDPIIQGSLSMDLIRQVVRDHHEQLQYCYSKELSRSPSLRGRLTIKWTIASDGYVTQAEVRDSTLDNSPVQQCVVGKIRAWRFPKPKGGGVVIVNYPFLFTANG